MLQWIRQFGHRLCRLGYWGVPLTVGLTLLFLLNSGQLQVEAQGTSNSPVFEMRFEADSVRVLRNEFQALGYRTADDEPPRRFPFPAVANSGARQVTWFDPDGTVRTNQSYSPEAHSVKVSPDGQLILVVHEDGGEYSGADVELLDAEGTSLWRERTHAYFGRNWSPSGETLVYPGDLDQAPYASFWGPKGLLVEYASSFIAGPAFSSDGRRVFVQEHFPETHTYCLSLFDSQGRRLWKRHCFWQPPQMTRHHEEWPRNSVQKVYISETGQYMAYSYYDRDSYVDNERTTPERFVVALDSLGNEMWTQPADWVHEISISEQLGRMVLLNNKYEGVFAPGDTEDLEILILALSTGTVQRRYPIADFFEGCWRVGPFGLWGDDLILGQTRRTRDIGFSVRLQRYDTAGTVSWEREIGPDSETRDISAEPVWVQRGPLVGVSIGRTFALFNLGQ